MITNKYESPPHYESLKRQRLRQIQEDYFPPPKKHRFPWLHSPPPQYIPPALYKPDYNDTFVPQPLFEVKDPNKLLSLIISILFSTSLFLLVFYNNSLNYGFYIFWAACLIMVAFHIIDMFDKRPHLTIDLDGLLFREKNLFIPWEHIIAIHICIEDRGEDDTEELLVDYIAVKTGTCAIHRFDLRGNDKSIGEIALALNYYNQQYLDLRQSTNSLTEAI